MFEGIKERVSQILYLMNTEFSKSYPDIWSYFFEVSYCLISEIVQIEIVVPRIVTARFLEFLSFFRVSSWSFWSLQLSYILGGLQLHSIIEGAFSLS